MITRKIAVKELLEYASTESDSDAMDIKKLALLVSEKKDEMAYDFFSKLDTFIREGVPAKAGHWLYVHRSGKKKAIVIPVALRLKGCKRVLKSGFEPGVVISGNLVFPVDADESEKKRLIYGAVAQLFEEKFEVVYGKEKEVRIK